ncbi:MAG: SUMF1/EgtB/PvdO family nonheme iron enzyme [Polyangiaceae bacterium]
MRSPRAALAGGAALLLACALGGDLPEAEAGPPAAVAKGGATAKTKATAKAKTKTGTKASVPAAKKGGQRSGRRDAPDRARARPGKRAAVGTPGGASRSRGAAGSAPRAGDGWTEARSPAATLPILVGPIRCPPEMVAVAGRVCVDRWEAHLVDTSSGAALSPYYPPQREAAAALFDQGSRARDVAPAGALSHLLGVPAPWAGELPPPPYTPRAVSAAGVVPSGYTNGLQAAEACRVAGKRLCTEGEWRTACRGDTQTQFPYGGVYRQDACNVFREAHPSQLLHGNASLYHDDPRLNALAADAAPLLRATGNTAECGSRWGNDAIWDMVGNLDEWVADPEGTFLGGFYSRATRQGCDARIGGHPIDYFDYSLGVRCCKDPE